MASGVSAPVGVFEKLPLFAELGGVYVCAPGESTERLRRDRDGPPRTKRLAPRVRPAMASRPLETIDRTRGEVRRFQRYRFACGLAAALAVLAVAGNVVADENPPDSTAAGESAFTAECAACHSSVSRLVRRLASQTPEERRAFLYSFLAGHYAADADMRAAIIAYLLAS